MNFLVKNAKLINGERIHIGIDNGKIENISNELNQDQEYDEMIDLEGNYYVSPGWIDMHTHCFEMFKLYSDNPDKIGIQQGVTTVVDAGTVGADNIDQFFRDSKKCVTNVYSLLNISRIGLLRQDELSDLKNVKIDLVEKAVNEYKNFIIGLKVRLSRTVVGNTNLKCLDIAKDASKKLQIPLMVHIGSEPPVLKDILNCLDKGDIVTHIFNGKYNSILKNDNYIKKEVFIAQEKGVLFDLGHGTDSFNFHVAKTAFKANIKVNTISSDIYSKNRINGPVYSLCEIMNKMFNIGYTLEEVIDKVTTAVVESLPIPNKGYIKSGYDADLTFFKVKETNRKAIDSQKKEIEIHKEIVPYAIVIKGKWKKLNEGETDEHL